VQQGRRGTYKNFANSARKYGKLFEIGQFWILKRDRRYTIGSFLKSWRKTSLHIKFKRKKKKKQLQQILLGSLKGTASRGLGPYFLVITQPVAVCHGR